MTGVLNKKKKRNPAIIITRFTNEAYLMPWWIQHHVKLFDHGILIDCGSKDHTADIVREYAPDWEIIRHEDKEFFVRDDMQETLDYERLYPGCWKLNVNPSEFFCTRDMDILLMALEADNAWGYAPLGINMADPRGYYNSNDLTYDKPLVSQRYHGYIERDRTTQARFTFSYPGIERYRSRVLHRHHDGNFKSPILGGNGIHYLGHPFIYPMPMALILWYVYSPWTPEMIERRLKQYYYMPENKRQYCPYPKNMGQLERDLEMELMETVDLRTKKEYRTIFSEWPMQEYTPSDSINHQDSSNIDRNIIEEKICLNK